MIHDKEVDTKAVLGWQDSGRVVVVAFRGTSSAMVSAVFKCQSGWVGLWSRSGCDISASGWLTHSTSILGLWLRE